MIALLLAAQLAAATLPQGSPLETIPPPRGYIVPPRGVIRALPATTCPGSGRMEASFGKPTALYRYGDRPGKILRRWVDYPVPRSCLVVEVAP
jgi:hypothetical protein